MTLLSAGPIHTLVQNTVYALPPRAGSIFSSLGLEVDNDTTFASPGTVTANTSTKMAAAFARCTTGAAIVSIKVD